MTLLNKIFGKRKEEQINFSELVNQKPASDVKRGTEKKEEKEDPSGQDVYETLQEFNKRLELIILDENLKDPEDRTELKKNLSQLGVVTYVVATNQEYEIHSKIYKPEKNVIIFGEYKHIAPREDIKRVFNNNGTPGEASVYLSLYYTPTVQDYLNRLAQFNEQTGIGIKAEGTSEEVITGEVSLETKVTQIAQPIVIEADEPKVQMPGSPKVEQSEADSQYIAPPPQEDFVGKMLREEKTEFENLVHEKTSKTTIEIKPKLEIDVTKAKRIEYL